jgi:conjugative transfer signal peptidase TraF
VREQIVLLGMRGRCRRLAVLLVVSGSVVFAALYLFAAVVGVRINTSYSLPMGLYIATKDPSAKLVEFCPTGLFARQSSEREYRSRGTACPDGAVPLLKPIVAREGDVVETTPLGIRVNGILLPQTAPLLKDGHSRALTPWPFGVYRVAPDTVWVASSYNRGSYDSRYIGPVSLSQIRRRLRPLWTL